MQEVILPSYSFVERDRSRALFVLNVDEVSSDTILLADGHTFADLLFLLQL